jgi:hypothetical protein
MVGGDMSCCACQRTCITTPQQRNTHIAPHGSLSVKRSTFLRILDYARKLLLPEAFSSKGNELGIILTQTLLVVEKNANNGTSIVAMPIDFDGIPGSSMRLILPRAWLKKRRHRRAFSISPACPRTQKG